MLKFSLNRWVDICGICVFPLLVAIGCGGGQGSSPPPPLQTYTTSFPVAENPISESGRWINGGAIGLDWTDISTTSGLAVGHQDTVPFSDATALLTGSWGADQAATGKVYSVRQNDACSQEVELRLRSSLAAHVSTGYEILFKASKTSQAYAQIVRWDGPLGAFTVLTDMRGAAYGVANGDTVNATIVGNVITAFINSMQVAQATDNTYTGGNPGMGFNLDVAPEGCAGTNGDYGFTSFTATVVSN